MARIEQRLASLGLTLQPPMQPLPDVALPFLRVRVFGDRAFVSGLAHALPTARWPSRRRALPEVLPPSDWRYVDDKQGDHVIVAPPYIITAAEIETIVEWLGEAVDAEISV